jgi:hypothetical protein
MSGDFSGDALKALLDAMDRNRAELEKIVENYPQEMKDFIAAEPGLKSRFSRYIDFSKSSPVRIDIDDVVARQTRADGRKGPFIGVSEFVIKEIVEKAAGDGYTTFMVTGAGRTPLNGPRDSSTEALFDRALAWAIQNGPKSAVYVLKGPRADSNRFVNGYPELKKGLGSTILFHEPQAEIPSPDPKNKA